MCDNDAVDILLVEDNLRDAELTIRALKKRNLINNLIHLEDGVAALDFLFCQGQHATRRPANSPKIILLDIKLPKVDGLEVLRQIKANEHTRNIPVVMITSSREDPDIKAAYDLGANSYVVKPVDFNSFLETMTNLGLYWLLVNQGPV